MIEAFLYTLLGGIFGFTIGIRVGYIMFGRWGEEMEDGKNDISLEVSEDA